MHLIGLFITLIFLIWFWIWFFNQVFSHLDGKNISKGKTLLRGGILVVLLMVYEKSFSWLGIQQELFIRDTISWQSIALFLGYVMLVIVGLTLLFKHFKNKKIWLQLFVSIFILLSLALGGGAFGITSLVVYYLLAGSTEELFKFTVGNNQSASVLSPSPSTLLLFALLIGFGFSIAENFIAFVAQLIAGETITTGLLLGRGLLSSLIHIVATGSIALLMMKLKGKILLVRYAVALILGCSIHIVYNLALVFGWAWLSVLLAIGGLFSLSYLIFHLDEVYEGN